LHDPKVWIGFAVCTTFALGLATTAITRRIAVSTGRVAVPRADRWHGRPTALGGGVAMFIAFMPALLLGGAPFSLVLGAGAMFLLGLVDDAIGLRPYTKLIAQFAVASVTVVAGIGLPWSHWPLLNQAIGIFWIVGITNALNLLDNMDGLAGGVTVEAALFQAAYFFLERQTHLGVLALCLAAACGAFLVFNWSPASIFMGDAGSMFLGYCLAVMATLHDYGRARGLVAALVAPVLVMLVPIFDTIFVTTTRILQGRSVTTGGRDHTSHRLVVLGLSETSAVTVLVAVGALGGILGLFARSGVVVGVWIAAALVMLGLGFLGIHLARTSLVSDRSSALQVRMLAWLADFAYKRRMIEVVLDIVLACIALLSAMLLRFDGEIPAEVMEAITPAFPLLVASKVVFAYLGGVYDGVWRHVSSRDALRIARATALGFGVTLVAFFFGLGLASLPVGVLFMDAIIFGLLVAGSRFSFRLLSHLLPPPRERSATRRRILVWGADETGAMLARRLLETIDADGVAVGFVDDNRAMLGRSIQGVRVLGSSRDIPDLLQKGLADAVVASPSVSAAEAAAMADRAGPGRIHRARVVYEEVAGCASNRDAPVRGTGWLVTDAE